ncbi:TRPM8 channel-associated factor homolog [Brienomyrus brachyistius]|uniref:TRPM8 channel-associated factor homolog n=1 Tax=Brienomyrus brachyistius TaxID=42636 RepID=UPI0020B19342|nr:TRPM8 channel-associated factor homolog [Brienomyrus brachyistius]XP_048872274.1 TRPM8 channel-associated factor homolog [Brienomyrus brachyistius]
MDAKAIYNMLVQKINKFSFGGTSVPCQLRLTSDMAVPVAVGPSGHVLIAASPYGKGRIVVMAHEAYMEEPEFGQFLQNAVSWLQPQPDSWVGVRKLNLLTEHLSKKGFNVKSLAKFDGSVGVFCCDAYHDNEAAEMVEFLKGGGGLLIGGQAWHWSYSHKEQDLQSFPGNKITRVAGISFTAAYGEKGSFPVLQKIPLQPIFTPNCKDNGEALKILLDGLTQFDLQNSSVPSSLLVHGLLAFSIAQDETGEVFLAASHYGGGRVVVIPHEGYLDQPAMQTFILNVIHWLDAGRNQQILVNPEIKHLHKMLSIHNINSKVSNLNATAGVYCCSSYSDAQAEEIHCFVSEGGGLLMAGQAWWWSYNNPGQDPTAGYPGNRILNRFGISILQHTVEQKLYKAPSVDKALKCPHFRKELSEMISHVKDHRSLQDFKSSMSHFSRKCTSFLKMKAHYSPMYTGVLEELTSVVTGSSVLKVSPEFPVKSETEKLILHLADTIYELNPGQLTTSILRPYVSTPITTITIDGSNKGEESWRSTGLYVSPGTQVTICVPPGVSGKGLQVQIGCHTDDLSHLNELKRAPVATRRFPVKSERVNVSSLWGGLLYLIVPPKSQLGSLHIVVENAVKAPYFKLGLSTVSSWQSGGRSNPAPWAELEADSIILTVPSSDVRHLDDPTPLLTLWTSIMEGISKLAAGPSPFPRPERIVADVQISAGWMHSGYPVMLHLKSVREIAQVEYMRSEGMWGPIHELGHNQQRDMWEFPPHTTEATCNLWSVYIHETVLNIPRHKAHPALKPEARKVTIKQYVVSGANLKDWTTWTCLETYLQLQEGFGWEAFIQLFSDYKAMPHSEMKKEEKMNLWAEKFSQKVKKNLVPFFKAWGWPIEDQVAKKVSSLPSWDKNPMIGYL